MKSIIKQARKIKCPVLTRNRKLYACSGITVIQINSQSPDEQLREAIISLKLKIDQKKVLTRCLLCNKKLILINKMIMDAINFTRAHCPGGM